MREDADKFTSQNITGVKVQWEPGQEFKNLRDDAEFNLVASRSAQAAVIKAIKEGKTNVDLNAPTTPDNTPGGSTPGGSNTAFIAAIKRSCLAVGPFWPFSAKSR